MVTNYSDFCYTIIAATGWSVVIGKEGLFSYVNSVYGERNDRVELQAELEKQEKLLESIMRAIKNFEDDPESTYELGKAIKDKQTTEERIKELHQQLSETS
jgi:hypothetical protein